MDGIEQYHQERLQMYFETTRKKRFTWCPHRPVQITKSHLCIYQMHYHMTVAIFVIVETFKSFLWRQCTDIQQRDRIKTDVSISVRLEIRNGPRWADLLGLGRGMYWIYVITSRVDFESTHFLCVSQKEIMCEMDKGAMVMSWQNNYPKKDCVSKAWDIQYFILLVRNFPWVSKAGSILGHSSGHCSEIICGRKTQIEIKVQQTCYTFQQIWQINLFLLRIGCSAITNNTKNNCENGCFAHHQGCCCKPHRVPWWLPGARRWPSGRPCWSGQTSLLHPNRSRQTQSRRANERSLLREEDMLFSQLCKEHSWSRENQHVHPFTQMKSNWDLLNV